MKKKNIGEQELLTLFNTLNGDGRKELLNYADLLASIDRLKKPYTVEKRENNIIYMRIKTERGENEKTTVPERLKALRGNKTQKEVADYIGVSQRTYAMYETGEITPNDENKRKLSMLFKKTVKELFFD